MQKNTVKYGLGIAVAIFAVFMIWYFRSIFIYLCISAVLSLIARPFVDLLKKIKIRKFQIKGGLAAFLTVALLWVIIVMVFRFVIPLVSREFQYLSSIDISVALENMERLLHQFLDPLKERNSDIYESIENQIKDMFLLFFNLNQIKNIFSSMLGFVGGTFVAAFSITFVTFFFLKEKGLAFKGLMIFVPSKYEENLKNAIESIKRLLRRYFIGILIQTTLIAILITSGFFIIGINFNHAAAIGVICGLLNVIPYVGPLIGFFIGLITGSIFYLQNPLEMSFLIYLLLICIVYATVQLTDNIVFQPVIFSTSVMAHPLEIFIVILMAGYSMGIVGMFIAIPVYTVLRVIAREFFSQYNVVQKITRKM